MITDYSPAQQKLVQGFFNAEGEEIYLRACSLLPDKPIVVEIGSNVGGTACLMGIQVHKKQGIYFSLDNQSEAHIYGDPLHNLKLFHKNMTEAGLLDTVVQVFTNSNTCDWHPSLNPHLLFVDGNHSEEGVQEDCDNWIKRVRPKGLIMFHDWEFPSVKSTVIKNTHSFVKVFETYKCVLFQKA